MRNIALIPARGGSKRFPGKNLALLDGKPLVSWTIDAVIKSGIFDKIVFSSDDDELLKIASKYDKIEIEQRDPSLSGDFITTSNVLENLINKKLLKHESYELCGLFLPTSPFRTAEDIKRAYELLDDKTDSVISYRESRETPEFMFRKSNDNNMHAVFKDSGIFNGMTRTQDHETVYYPNGAIYLAWTEKFLKYKTFYMKNIKGYVMPLDRSLDIDHQEDLIYAKYLLTIN